MRRLGDVELNEDTTGARKDYQIEMEMNRMVHLGVAVASTYAIIQIQNYSKIINMHVLIRIL